MKRKESGMDLSEIIRSRRSVRNYTGEEIPEEKVNEILNAGLLAPSGRNLQSGEFIVVRDKEMLEKLSMCRLHGSQILANADAAIIVVADSVKQDVWVEDASISMTLMHLMADSLGIGSCWIQGRLRTSPEGESTEDYIRRLVGFPEGYSLEAILSLGMPQNHPEAKDVSEEALKRVHREKW